MYDFTDIVRSVELPIGTRFYFRDRLYEVAELEHGKWGCSPCVFDNRYDKAICKVMRCNAYRCDDKSIYFKKVKEENNE